MLQLTGIAEHTDVLFVGEVQLQPIVPLGKQGGQGITDLHNQGHGGEILQVDLHLAGLDLGKVENFIDQAQ